MWLHLALFCTFLLPPRNVFMLRKWHQKRTMMCFHPLAICWVKLTKSKRLLWNGEVSWVQVTTWTKDHKWMCHTGKGAQCGWNESLFSLIQCEVDLRAMIYLKSYSEVLETEEAGAQGNFQRHSGGESSIFSWNQGRGWAMPESRGRLGLTVGSGGGGIAFWDALNYPYYMPSWWFRSPD